MTARRPSRYRNEAWALSVGAAILRLTMRGDDLLLRHLAALPAPEEEEAEERPSARERLDAELGREFAGSLLAALTASRA